MKARVDTAANPRVERRGRARTYAALAGLVAAILVAYASGLTGPFVLDDLTAIKGNPTLRQLWPVTRALSPPRGGGETVEGRPVLNVSFALNYAVGGLDVRGYHVVNVGIHVLATLALFGCVRRTLLLPPLRPRFGQSSLFLAWTIALLWAVHPLQTSAVTYVSRRADVLAGALLLFTVYGFLRCVEQRNASRWAFASVASCALGVGTKETVALAPVLVLLLDCSIVAGGFQAAWRLRWKLYVGLAATWMLLAWLLSGSVSRGGSVGFDSGVSWWHYALTQAGAVTHYLRLSVWPHPLVFDYGTEVVNGLARVFPQVLLIGFLIVASTAGLWRRSALGFLGAWFFLLLAPSSSVLPIVTQTVAEHRMYLPLVAVIAMVVCLGHVVGGRNAVAVLCFLAVPLGFGTWMRNRDYRDELTLWGDTVARRPDNARAWNAYGRALVRAGRNAEAIEALSRAVNLAPESTEALANLGNALVAAGRPEEGIEPLREAARLDPDSFAIRANLASAYQHSGRASDAAEQFAAAVRLNPEAPELHVSLARVLLLTGNAQEAITHCREAVRTAPESVEARYLLGNALAESGRLEEAVTQFEEVVRLQPQHVEAQNNLGNALLLLRRPHDAIPHYEAALGHTSSAMTYTNLAMAHLLVGGLDEADSHFRAALAINPDHAPARAGLARVQALRQVRPP